MRWGPTHFRKMATDGTQKRKQPPVHPPGVPTKSTQVPEGEGARSGPWEAGGTAPWCSDSLSSLPPEGRRGL